MIYIFCGEDTFESFYQSKLFLNKLKKERKIEAEILDAEDLSWSELVDKVDNIDMFAREKIFYIKRFWASSKTKLTEDKIGYLDKSENIYIFWEQESFDPKTPSIQILKKDKKFFSFDNPKDFEFVAWIIDKFKTFGFKVDKKIAESLVDLVGFEKGVLYQEIKKICLYASFKSIKQIDEDLVNKLCVSSANGNIWKFLDYFGKKDKKNTLLEFQKLMRFEDNGQYIISMLAREIRLYIKVKHCLSKKIDTSILGLHPYVLKKTIEKQKNFTFEELENISFNLIELDVNIKTGFVDENLGLVDFLYKNIYN